MVVDWSIGGWLCLPFPHAANRLYRAAMEVCQFLRSLIDRGYRIFRGLLAALAPGRSERLLAQLRPGCCDS